MTKPARQPPACLGRSRPPPAAAIRSAAQTMRGREQEPDRSGRPESPADRAMTVDVSCGCAAPRSFASAGEQNQRHLGATHRLKQYRRAFQSPGPGRLKVVVTGRRGSAMHRRAVFRSARPAPMLWMIHSAGSASLAARCDAGIVPGPPEDTMHHPVLDSRRSFLKSVAAASAASTVATTAAGR